MGRTGFVLGVLLAAGCVGPKHDMVKWQLDYARGIPSPATRGQALGSVALTAAYLGDAGGVKQALRELKDDPSHDEFAARCAVELKKNGHPEDARRIAKRVTDPERRKDVFEKLDQMGQPTNVVSPADAGPAAQPPPAPQ